MKTFEAIHLKAKRKNTLNKKADSPKRKTCFFLKPMFLII